MTKFKWKWKNEGTRRFCRIIIPKKNRTTVLNWEMNDLNHFDAVIINRFKYYVCNFIFPVLRLRVLGMETMVRRFYLKFFPPIRALSLKKSRLKFTVFTILPILIDKNFVKKDLNKSLTGDRGRKQSRTDTWSYVRKSGCEKTLTFNVLNRQ